MKLSRQFTVFGSAIFCVVIFSLYLMLDHIDHSKNPNGERIQNVSTSVLRLSINCVMNSVVSRCVFSVFRLLVRELTG